MNVLHLTTHLNAGGITRYIFELCVPMRDRGIDFQVLSSGGDFAERFHEIKIPLHQTDIRTKFDFHPKLFSAVAPIREIIRRQKIDILHAHTRVAQVLAHLIKLNTQVPVVTTCHGFYQNRFGRCVLPAWGDRAVAISPAVQDHLIEDFKVPIRRTSLVQNAVNVDKLMEAYQRHAPAHAKKSFGLNPEHWTVGVVARLVPDKGHDYLIEALKILAPKMDELRLLIVGGGKNRTHLEELVKKLDLEDRVVFTGSLNDVSRALAAIDIFVFPAIWREGFGLSIVEAMAVKKPVIITDICAINSLIDHGVTGLKVQPRNPHALAKAIQTLSQDPRLCEQITEESRRLVKKLFEIDRMTDELAQVYKTVTA